MKRATKVWLILGASLVLSGCILFGGVMTVLNWNFEKLATVKYETNEHTVAEVFEHIAVTADTANIAFAPSDNNDTRIVCREQQHATHTVAVKDGTLTIALEDNRVWYEHIGIGVHSPAITVYLPQNTYGALTVRSNTGHTEIAKEFCFDSINIAQSTGNVTSYACAAQNVKIQTTTGNIRVENVSVGALDLTVSTGKTAVSHVTCKKGMNLRAFTGKTTVTDVTCNDFTSNGTTGHLSLSNVIAAGTVSVERNTGNVTFDKCDAAELSVKTSTGNIKGSLLSEKVFITHTGTGSVKVPETVNGGKCNITTDTGSILIEIASS